MTALLKGIGKQFQVGIAQEASRGTPASSATYWLPLDDFATEQRYNNAVDSQIYGLVEDNVGQTRVKNWTEADLKMPLTGTSAAVLFHSLFGTCNSVLHAGETVVYDNTMNVLQNVQHKTLTVFLHDPIATAAGATADFTHKNAVVSKVTIDYSLGNWVMLNASLRAQAQSAAAVVFAPSQTQEPRFVPQYLTFKVASTYSGLGAATAIKIKNAQIVIDSSGEDDDVLGSTSPRDFLNKEFSLEGTIEAIWQNESDFKSAAIANTPQAMRLDLVNSDLVIGTSTSPEFRIDLAKVYFTEFSRPVKIKDVVYQTVKFKAAYSISDAFMAKALFTSGARIDTL